MPELPEVEVTRRKLTPGVQGRRIAGVQTTRDSYFFVTKPARLKRHLIGRQVLSIERLGKYLLLPLDDGHHLVLHLGMTGQLFFARPTSGSSPDPHTHLQLSFTDGPPCLLFRDVRKFGKVVLSKDLAREPRLSKLGVDALRATGQNFWQRSRRRRIAVKTLLLDQSVLAGVGNIYADEALFLSGILPRRKATSLSLAQCERLIAQVKAVLLRAIERGGSSISDYIHPDGTDGSYQQEHFVYGKPRTPCQVCGSPIRRSIIGGRSTHFCSICQS